jgi:hypothetical protein
MWVVSNKHIAPILRLEVIWKVAGHTEESDKKMGPGG